MSVDALRLSQLEDLLQGPAFAAWWLDLGRTEATLREARARRDDLQAQAALMKARADAAEASAAETLSRAKEAERRARGMAAESREAEERARQLAGRFEAQPQAGRRRDRLWEQVERARSRAFGLSLQVAERRQQARRVRLAAERLLEEAGERRARWRRLWTDLAAARREHGAAIRARSRLLAAARQRFGCVAGTSFLYWRSREDGHRALALALADDGESYNVEVRALGVYRVDRRRGVALLDPARE